MIYLLILIFCIFILFFYYKVKNYDSIKGIILFFVGIILLIIKLNHEKKSFLSLFMVNFKLASLYVIAYTIFALLLIFLIKKKSYPKKVNYNITLLILYIFFGTLQQIFFQYIFLDTIYKIILSYKITLSNFSIFIGAIYYMLFHLEIKNFWFETFVIGLGWAYLYLAFGNIFWLGISHGILGTIYFSRYINENVIKKKLRFYKFHF